MPHPTRPRVFWVAKQDRANISDAELKAFRDLAKAHAKLSVEQVDALVTAKDWIEICTEKLEVDEQAPLQE